MAFFQLVWSWVQWLGQILVPVFAATPWRGALRVLGWVLHFALVALFLAGLAYLNYALNLEMALRSSWPFLHRIWLPLLFLLLYILCWLGYWLYLLLGPERMPVSFPEIDAAWQEGQQALQRASIDISRVPVYLVLGRPASGEDSFFHAAQLPLAVQATPHAAEAPLRVYANRDAVFVTCAASSLLGQQAKLFVEHQAKEAAKAGRVQTPAPASDVQAILWQAQAQRHGPDQPTAEEKKPTSDTVAQEQERQLPVPETASAPVPLLKNKAAVEHSQARLRHLCRLIVQARRPRCPLNGIFVLIPEVATRGDIEAGQITTLCRLDLEAVREVMQVECPQAVVVCDLEKARGFREFLQPLAEARRLETLGQRFALVPDIDANEVPLMFEKGVDHLCQERLGTAVHGLFRLDPNAAAAPPGKVNGPLSDNLRLFQFQAELRQARRRVARILQRGMMFDPEAPPMVAGVYLAGTGLDTRDQAFVAGIFQDMHEQQNFVAWTPQAFLAESHYRRVVRLGYITLAVIVVVVGGMAYFVLGRS